MAEITKYTPDKPKPIRAIGSEQVYRVFRRLKTGMGCWEWIGNKTRDGYGRVTLGKVEYRVHRVTYTWANGPIPDDLTLDHLCGNKACANPTHLEPVTIAINLARNAGRRTHCKRGHVFDEANTYYPPGKNGGRHCRACQAAVGRVYQRRRLAEAR